MQRSQTSAEGSLYELVARGVKDKYFIQDDTEAIHPFDWRYERYPASVPEIRLTVPTNPSKFNSRCEFEFDLPGDILKEATLLIDLPTWLPSQLAANAQNRIITDQNGYVNGYVNGIAYFLFEKIEIYQDKILLQEVSGDSLYAAALTKGSFNNAFLIQSLAGMHDGSPLSISRNAVPGRLELPLPMIGCSLPGDRGLPLCGLRDQTFRLRLTLRPLESLIESNSPSNSPPTPWLSRFTQGTTTLQGVSRDSIQQPTLTLRTKQYYLGNEARAKLADETIEIPYIRYFDNRFIINQLDYSSVQNGATTNIVRFLDANYTVERIITFFRNQGDKYLNRLWKFTNDKSADKQYYTSIQLTIAGKVREEAWPPSILQTIIGHAKEDRTTANNISILNWSRGWRVEDSLPSLREPTGGINFTTADRPMLSIGLNDVIIDPQLGYKQVFMNSCCESWALYKIRNRRGGLEYAN